MEKLPVLTFYSVLIHQNFKLSVLTSVKSKMADFNL